MNWNWDAILQAFMAYGPHVLFCGIVLVGIYGVTVLLKAIATSKKVPVEKSADIAFLEGALDEDPVRKPNPNYSYDQFRADLENKGISFEEIYEKSGGAFPKKPEAPKESETKAEKKKEEGPGAKSDDPERLASLHAWYNQRLEGKVLKLVPPPPAPHTVIHKIYTRGRR